MSARHFERVLAELYTDPVFRAEFLSDADLALQNRDLEHHEREALIRIDRAGQIQGDGRSQVLASYFPPGFSLCHWVKSGSGHSSAEL